ncbi:MAG: hypothetical protein KJ958_02445 [Gammaproteobacteria bacterium]|nr:hypothetical protein [Gammaproteobacteria bacterium]MBU1978009.1 hypothetical protein [Gammaproteobacteria bacterium]
MRLTRLWAMLIGFGLSAASLCSHAENHTELLFFPAVTASHRPGLPEGDDLKRNYTEPTLDVFATGNLGSIIWLSEIFVSEHEREWSRLHAGWRFDSGNMLSLGKFHNLQGYWNTQFHHGTFLQTTIDKPGLVEDGSPIPSHYIGMQLEGKLSEWDSEGTIKYSAGIGKGAVLKERLVSPDIVGPARLGDLTAGLRLAYSPDETSPTQIGVFFVRNRVPVKADEWSSLTQNIGGVFANWEYQRFRVIGELFIFDDTLTGASGAIAGNFLNTYLQGEFRFAPNMAAYARAESTRGGGGGPLLAMLPEFIRERDMFGLRHDITRNQTVKIEASRVRRLDDGFRQLQIQWSAVYP